MCREKDETVNHRSAQRFHRKDINRRDRVIRVLHWDWCNNTILKGMKWYEYIPKNVEDKCFVEKLCS